MRPVQHQDAQENDHAVNCGQQDGQDGAKGFLQDEQQPADEDHHRQHTQQDQQPHPFHRPLRALALRIGGHIGQQTGVEGQDADVGEDGGIAENKGL